MSHHVRPPAPATVVPIISPGHPSLDSNRGGGGFDAIGGRPLVLYLSQPDDFVFDPIMGSGTLPAAAQALGRRWLGHAMQRRANSLARHRPAQSDPGEATPLDLTVVATWSLFAFWFMFVADPAWIVALPVWQIACAALTGPAWLFGSWAWRRRRAGRTHRC